MGYALQLNIEQLLGVIKTLPHNEKSFLKTYLEKEMVKKKGQEHITELLLKGPTMTDDEYQSYLQLKKDFKKWSKKLSL